MFGAASRRKWRKGAGCFGPTQRVFEVEALAGSAKFKV
jgi:hypothetical protein